MIEELGVRKRTTHTYGVKMTVEDLCKLFYSNHYIEYDYKSCCEDEKLRADYLKELITSYEAFEHGVLNNAVIVLFSSKQYPLMMEETRLAAYIAETGQEEYSSIYKVDDSLGKELRINVAFYEYEKEK